MLSMDKITWRLNIECPLFSKAVVQVTRISVIRRAAFGHEQSFGRICTVTAPASVVQWKRFVGFG